MSDLIVIGYEDPQTARRAYGEVQRLQRDFIVDLRGLAIVGVDADGKTHVDTPPRIIGTSAHHRYVRGRRGRLSQPNPAICLSVVTISTSFYHF